MAIVLNRCATCGREIETREVGYFHLNQKTDRFDLECSYCYEAAEFEPNAIV